MVDKEMLSKKIALQKVRNILKAIKGIKILCIYEEYDFTLEHISTMGYTSYSKQPDSKIPIDSNDSLICQWIKECMKLKNNDVLFLLCNRIWIKIQIIEVTTATQSLWNNIDSYSKGFTVLTEKMDKLLEVGNDSRDEWNYLFDEYSIANSSLKS